jgi:3-oxoacyl-[acyl-carrier protein] reductase
LGNSAAYAATKGALHGLAKTLALEFARWSTTVNVVAPGYVNTPMTDAHSSERRGHLTQTIPLGRYGNANEVAALVAWLCLPEASYVTGQIINVDGGLSLR